MRRIMRADANGGMTAFVESCVETAAGSAQAAERRSRGKPKVRKLIKLLADKRRILITTHKHPDPDGLCSALGLRVLLCESLPRAEINISVSGRVGGGLNEAFVRYAKLNLTPWDEPSLREYDAIILLDAQPGVAYCPLPANLRPLAVIDHHGRVGSRVTVPFCDIRTDVGATGSIIFSYLMETETPISPQLAAVMLYGIETDLAGAAGSPTELDNVALSSLTLVADTRRLYQMRYVDLPREYYVAYAQGLASAVCHENVMLSRLENIDSPEKPAVIADFLLRYDRVDWVLVTALYERKLVLSLRANQARPAADGVIRKLLRGLGQGGGHTTKAGGFVELADQPDEKIASLRTKLEQRFLRSLGIKPGRGEPLVPAS